MIALPVRNFFFTLISSRMSIHTFFIIAFYGYFFDLLAADDTIPPTHPTTGFGFSKSYRDTPFFPHTTMDRSVYTCNTSPFYFGGFFLF
jgi:hypothetical protein